MGFFRNIKNAQRNAAELTAIKRQRNILIGTTAAAAVGSVIATGISCKAGSAKVAALQSEYSKYKRKITKQNQENEEKIARIQKTLPVINEYIQVIEEFQQAHPDIDLNKLVEQKRAKGGETK